MIKIEEKKIHSKERKWRCIGWKLFFLLESLPECSVLWETLSITSTELLTADLSTSATTCGTSPWNEGTRSSSTKLLINQSINHRLFYRRACEGNKNCLYDAFRLFQGSIVDCYN
ncbi:hypothetical protein P8452_68209 [Trifolium repens]|nr:hypothetical protein P8452_68209 [Trifolium repens]